jgi:hypothetical protein
MTELEITERLILAAEIEGAAGHFNVGPGRGPGYVKAMALPYVHSWADMNGWGKERLKEDEREYQDSVHRQPTPQMVSEAEEALGWYSVVENPDHRHALAAWVGCMADNGRRYFKDWCYRHDISEKTGRKRKNAAIASIRAHLVRSDVQNYDNGSGEGLPDTPETDDVDGRIGDAWRDGFCLRSIPEIESFDWADKRNAHRRKMAKRKAEEQARKRQKEAA